ncbi:MAG: CbrC family protein, partial [Gammaproteobacteria bacterium]|nr:CbrC family protein [Gammaproteobacteria bacterium]
KEIKEEVSFRTPGFSGWQQERWWTHCNDAAAFLGVAGKNEIEEYGEELVAEVKKETGYNDEEWNYYFKSMDKNGSPTAYIFRCLHCGKLGGYSDCD